MNGMLGFLLFAGLMSIWANCRDRAVPGGDPRSFGTVVSTAVAGVAIWKTAHRPSVRFLLIGLEVLVLRFEPLALALAGAAIPIVLLGCLLAVTGPVIVFAWSNLMSIRNVPFLTWAGIRGGISVALALSLPDSPARPAILAATDLFSIIVQGSTLGIVARRTIGSGKNGESGAPEYLISSGSR